MSSDTTHAEAIARLEAENRDLRERLDQAIHLLERGGRHELVARLSSGGLHQLRNLMTGLHGNARLLLEEKPIGDPDRDALLSITRSSSGVIELLSRYGRVLSPAAAADPPESIELGEEIAHLDPILRTLFGEWIALDVDLLESARVRLPADRFRFILLLVASRVLDRMPSGGMVRLALQRDRTVDDDGTVRRWAVVTMADTGEPLSEADLDAAFDPLGSDPGDGLGLGLDLCLAQRTVEAIGGRVTVLSDADGTAFRIDLPMAASPANPASTTPVAPGGPEAATILVVDDDDAVRMVAGKILHRFGYRILDAASGAEALEVLAGCVRPPDLLLTDIVMPGMNGRELAERVREEWPTIPTLFMSAYTEDEVILHGIRVAEVNFLPKPFTLEGLADAVRRVIDARQSV